MIRVEHPLPGLRRGVASTSGRAAVPATDSGKARCGGHGGTAYRKTPQQGAATCILLAASPEFEGVTGRYFDDCDEAEIVDERREQPIGTVAGYALDPSNADRLWAMAEKMIGADQ
jgi:hypothetical protein